jgi:hypothetical protein
MDNYSIQQLISWELIRSTVRRLVLGKTIPFTVLDCIVILGICTLESLTHLESPLLDSATVFQTAMATNVFTSCRMIKIR